MTNLYAQIIEYQAHAVVYIFRPLFVQYMKDTVKSDKWEDWLEEIKKLESECLKIMGLLNPQRLYSTLQEMSIAIDRLNENQLQQLQTANKTYSTAVATHKTVNKMYQDQENRSRSEEESKYISGFATTDYELHKNRNLDRVSGTCKWFLGHSRFSEWQKSPRSALLWVSADPGTGKSVLANSLVDIDLRATNSRTTCYFFFKEDFSEQRSIENAVAALLHQLFASRGDLLKYAIPACRIEGSNLIKSFSKMWNILRRVAEHPQTGEIVCILDGLDECEETGRDRLIDALTLFYDRDDLGDAKLKIIVTSRPYFQIERRFGRLTTHIPTIRLAGEEESEAISKEIDLVISARVNELLWLEKPEQDVIEEALHSTPNRTYLWVHLILSVIEKELETDRKALRETITKLPKTLEQVYERILSKCTNVKKATKLLHIVVAAIRPLSWLEVHLALNVDNGCRKAADLELNHDQKDRAQTRIRNLCGLFVIIVDARVYLIHQTALEFLVPALESMKHPPKCIYHSPPPWKASLDPRVSHFILAQACINYLRLDEIGNNSLPVDDTYYDHWLPLQDLDTPRSRVILEFQMEHTFVVYAATKWVEHLRLSGDDLRSRLLEPTLELFRSESHHFKTWMLIHKLNLGVRGPTTMTGLMAACRFGYTEGVTLLLEGNHNINLRDPKGRTALTIAATYGRVTETELLLKYSEILADTRDNDGRTPLSHAAGNGHAPVVQLLLRHKDIELNSYDTSFRTPLSYAAERGHLQVIQQLIECGGAHCSSNGQVDWAPLTYAATNGHHAVCTLLLDQPSVEPDWKDSAERTAFSYAAERDRLSIVELLLNRDDIEVDLKDNYGRTPLSHAAGKGNIGVVKILVNHPGVDVNSRDTGGQTPLSHAAGRRAGTEVLELLWRKGAEIDSRCTAGRTPLSYAAVSPRQAIVEFLLDCGAEIDSKDVNGRTPLSYAAGNGRHRNVEALAKRGAHVDSKDNDGMPLVSYTIKLDADTAVTTINSFAKYGANVDLRNSVGMTPMHLFAEKGYRSVVECLISHGAKVTARDADGRTPLLVAAQSARGELPKTVEYLLKSGADVNAQDAEGQTALISSAKRGRIIVVHHLAEHPFVNLDLKDVKGRSALSYAACDQKEVATYLMKRGADVDSVNIAGRTPLSFAVELASLEILEAFAELGNINAHLKDLAGRTPLSYTAARPKSDNFEKILKIFASAPADFNSTDLKGWTLLFYAAHNRQTKLVKALTNYTSVDVNTKDLNGRSALSYAAGSGYLDIVTLLIGCKDIATDAKDLKGRTPLSYATGGEAGKLLKVQTKDESTSTRRPEVDAIIELLATHPNVNLNSEDWQGLGPIDWAKNRGTIEHTRVLERCMGERMT